MTDQQPTDDVIARVLSGEATGDEAAAVERWAAGSPERQALLARLREAWVPRGEPGGWDLDRAWGRVAAKVESGDHPVEIIPIPGAPRWSTTVLRIAALVVVVVGIAFAWRTLQGGGAEYATAAGEVREVVLSDGTTVVLAPGSRLRVPARFGRDRTVRLEGEGWFSIATESGFMVETGRYRVRDIGTVFTLRSRHGDSLAVVVLEGAVVVHREVAAEDTLHAGTVAEFAGDSTVALRQAADPAALVGWRHGALEFDNAPASQVAARLSEWHGVTVAIADPLLASRPVTVTLPTASLDEALDVLALLLGTTIDRGDGSIVLR